MHQNPTKYNLDQMHLDFELMASRLSDIILPLRYGNLLPQSPNFNLLLPFELWLSLSLINYLSYNTHSSISHMLSLSHTNPHSFIHLILYLSHSLTHKKALSYTSFAHTTLHKQYYKITLSFCHKISLSQYTH